jgi:hypothetical protein
MNYDLLLRFLKAKNNPEVLFPGCFRVVRARLICDDQIPGGHLDHNR